MKHSSIEKITVVEIDREVIHASTKHFPFWPSAFNDGRVKLVIDDAIEYVKKSHYNTYDIVIVDSTDPSGFSLGLFENDF